MRKFFITFILGLMICGHTQASVFYIKPTVAVFTFGSTENFKGNFDGENAGFHFSDYVVEFLMDSRKFEVIEAEYLMRQNGIRIPRFISRGTAERIGRKLNADYVIYGKVKSSSRYISDNRNFSEVRLGDSFRVKMSIYAAMVDVNNGDVVSKVNYAGAFKLSQTDVPRHSIRSLFRRVAEGFVDSVIENFSAGSYYVDNYDYYGVEDNETGEEW